MKCIRIDRRKPVMDRAHLVFSSMLKILDGTIEVLTLGYVRSSFCLVFMRKRLKYLLKRESYVNQSSRSSGHNAVRTSKVRSRGIKIFMYWYFQEYGVVMPRELVMAFRTGFNMGWKGRKVFGDRKKTYD